MVRRDDRLHLVSVRPGDEHPEVAANDSPNGVEVCVDSAGEMSIDVPPTTPEQCFHASIESGCIASNDMRLMARCTDGGLDERGVFALFQYGAIPAPLSIVSGVHRIPCGHRVTLNSRGDTPSYIRQFNASTSNDPPSAKQADGRFLEVLDAILASAGDQPVLYFSGGIDSSLLAWRMKCIGRDDVRLFNYGFGDEDADRIASRRTAEAIGLRLECVTHDEAGMVTVLDHLADDYSFPFGDFSTLPTNLLVRASIERFGPRTFIEGTGADGLFGIGMTLSRWQRSERVPRPIRRLIAAMYGPLNAWKWPSANSRIESVLRVFRRTTQMSLPLAVVSQNPLDGVAYRMPRGVRDEIDGAIGAHILSMSEGTDDATTLSMLDLVQVCAGIFAAKSFDPLRMRGAEVRYPFLEPDILSLGCELPWTMKCVGGTPKGMLKNLLRGIIPDAVLDRPKTGFTPPLGRMLAGDVLQDFLRGVVLSPGNPVIEHCDASLVRRMADHVRRREQLSVGASNYLWMLIFLSGWWRGVRMTGG